MTRTRDVNGGSLFIAQGRSWSRQPCPPFPPRALELGNHFLRYEGTEHNAS